MSVVDVTRAVAIRSAGLVVVAAVTQLLAEMDDSPDANIGLGLLL